MPADFVPSGAEYVHHDDDSTVGDYDDFRARVKHERAQRNEYVIDSRGFHVHPDHQPTPAQLAVDIRAAHDEHRAYLDRGDHELLHARCFEDPVYERWLDQLHQRIGCSYDR